jgi:O-antigen ligase
MLGVVLAFAAIRHGAVLEADRFVMTLGAGAVAIACFLPRKRGYELAPPLRPWLRWPLFTLLGYGIFQCVPLPPAILGALSPARAEIAAAVGGGWAPLSVAPTQTLFLLMTLAVCVLTLLVARDAAWKLDERPWLAGIPIALIAVLEAGLGLAQFFSNQPGGVAHGTYVNRNHFSGLLEMALPFALAYALDVRLAAEPGRTQRWGPALGAATALAAGALILAGIVYSLSRMGFTAALVGLGAGTAALIGKRITHRGTRNTKARWALVVLAAAVVGGLFVYLPPDQLVSRFAQLAATDEISADTRVAVWRETLALVRAYPVFGCGLGGFETAFLKHKSVAPMNTVDYAHNDYLQGLAELGVVGFGLCLILAVVILREAWRKPAVVAALAAIALHSLVDFNLYIPANAMTLAWAAGLATSD